MTAVRCVSTPLGTMRLTGTDAGLTGAVFAEPCAERAPELLAESARELEEYFAGTRRSFTVPLAPAGTEFQRAVWAKLCAVPYGTCRTYADIAAQLGKPGAARAVGGAVGANPCVIFIPCHRIVARGGLGGFSCGLARKKALLTLEGIPFCAPATKSHL